MSSTIITEKDLNFCLWCGRDAKWQDYHTIQDGKRWRIVSWKCQHKNCGKERIITSYPTIKQTAKVEGDSDE